MDSHNGHRRGYALVQIEAGHEREFFQQLYDIPGIGDVHFIADGYDFLVTVDGEGPEDVAAKLAKQIRRLPGITRMATYIEGRHFGPA